MLGHYCFAASALSPVVVAMTDVADGLTNLTQTARDVAINNASTLAFADANNTDGWVVGPDECTSLSQGA